MRSGPRTPGLAALAALAVGGAMINGCARDESSPAAAVSAPALRAVRLSPVNHGAPLQREAYRAELAFAGQPPGAVVKAGGGSEYAVVITNRGPTPFPAFPDDHGRGAVNLTCRTYRAGPPREVAGGCNRASLPADLQPGASTTLNLFIPFPAEPGIYEVDIELVHEQLVWFVDMGSPPLKVRISAR